MFYASLLTVSSLNYVTKSHSIHLYIMKYKQFLFHWNTVRNEKLSSDLTRLLISLIHLFTLAVKYGYHEKTV